MPACTADYFRSPGEKVLRLLCFFLVLRIAHRGCSAPLRNPGPEQSLLSVLFLLQPADQPVDIAIPTGCAHERDWSRGQWLFSALHAPRRFFPVDQGPRPYRSRCAHSRGPVPALRDKCPLRVGTRPTENIRWLG